MIVFRIAIMIAVEPVEVSTVSSDVVNSVFGRKLRDLRRERDLSQSQLGDLLGLSRVTIANIESGKQNVQLHQIFSLASVLDIHVDRLIPSPNELEHSERFMGRVRSDLLAASDILFLEFAHSRLTEFAGGMNVDKTAD